MNVAILCGRLVRDPEERITAGANGNTTVSRFALAVDRRQAKKEGEPTADFINCVAFGKTAEFINKYFTKGRRIGITGRIQTGSYTNKDGAKVYTTDVIAETAEFIDSKNDAQGQTQGQTQPQGDPMEGFMNIAADLSGDDLPFV